ncbi:hypothetical protein DL93DRAFT_2082272 [Clavulina sp. PMI_390]|nr:hypothetical protein DL93DRAFT_2082272 [Clavulina sp. PMI_390]
MQCPIQLQSVQQIVKGYVDNAAESLPNSRNHILRLPSGLVQHRPLDSQPKLHQMVAGAESDADELVKLSEALLNTANNLRNWARDTRNVSQAPILGFPEELIAMVFLHGLNASEDAFEAIQWTLRVSGVCSSWRRAALTLGVLWATVSANSCVGSQNLWLQRAGTWKTKLHVVVTCARAKARAPRSSSDDEESDSDHLSDSDYDSEDEYDLWGDPPIPPLSISGQGIFSEQVKWESLELRVGRRCYRLAEEFLKHFYPAQRLTILLDPRGDDTENYDDDELQFPLSRKSKRTGEDYTFLSDLKIVGVSPEFGQQLRWIALKLQTFVCHSAWSDWCPTCALMKWRSFFQAAKNLRSCEVTWSALKIFHSHSSHDEATASTPDSLQMSRLRKLVARCQDWTMATTLLTQLRMPKLMHLELDLGCDNQVQSPEARTKTRSVFQTLVSHHAGHQKGVSTMTDPNPQFSHTSALRCLTIKGTHENILVALGSLCSRDAPFTASTSDVTLSPASFLPALRRLYITVVPSPEGHSEVGEDSPPPLQSKNPGFVQELAQILRDRRRLLVEAENVDAKLHSLRVFGTDFDIRSAKKLRTFSVSTRVGNWKTKRVSKSPSGTEGGE